MIKDNYENLSKTIDTSNVESQKVTEDGQTKYYDDQYEYLKRQHYLATHMELTEENVN